MMATQHDTAMTRAAQALTPNTEAQITRIMNDHIARAYLTKPKGARAMALAYNAHLTTELRLNNIWPTRDTKPCQ